jgi:hypothetical protein
MANTDRGKTRCPYVRPQFVPGSAGKEMQQCVEGELIIYDADTFKELRREPHKFCEGKGWIQH